jgi:hypothetical protein
MDLESIDYHNANYELQKAICYAEVIQEDTGIDLTWKEVLDIKLNYTDGSIHIEHIFPAIYADFFGLDYYGLCKPSIGYINFNGEVVKVSQPGLSMLGTPEFKAYCRAHINEWRSERDLI